MLDLKVEKSETVGSQIFYLWFKNINEKENKPLIIVDENNLKGGQAGTTPQITISNVQNTSYRSFYEPIQNDFMFQAFE